MKQIHTCHSECDRPVCVAVRAEREKVARWMRSMGYATGHGDSIEMLLDELGKEIADKLGAEVRAERERACVIVTGLCISDNNAREINDAIRGKK